MSGEAGRAAAGAAESAARAVQAVGEVAGATVDGRLLRAGRRAGVFGLSVGVVAAGAAAGVALERLTVGRTMRLRARAELDAAAPFGSLRGVSRQIAAEDGTRLYVELDGLARPGRDTAAMDPAPDCDPASNPVASASDPASAAAFAEPPGEDPDDALIRRGWFGRRRPQQRMPACPATAPTGADGTPGAALGGTAPLTVVFCHGYCLNQDSWHFQRARLRDDTRLVFWDQRSHGRSERGHSYQSGEAATIDQLGGDLRAVLDAVAPEGPLVLVGHSMGGMTIMALADQDPDYFSDRVAGVALIGTTAGNWREVTLGLPAYGAKVLHRFAPGVLRVLGRQVELVEATRRAGSELTAVLYRKFSFGSGEVDPAVARFAEQMLEATPIDVVAEFYPAFGLHDKTSALAAMDGIPTLVLAGTRDLLTPPGHSEAIAEALPGAELVLVPDAGHLVMLEHPELVGDHLAALLERAARRCGALPSDLPDCGEEGSAGDLGMRP
ncbi:alpha/beta fold hydrolase [Peterkaempfera bronchialis]|uniref:Alpha/beta hydrolase n=1 Tax=Peterkaempfera bronchialis TaxID=2126346 RepID=A0A345SW94_9ACTN|nr:alpha/beta hydrolase [Peterkaempfera bronchialis]AXI77999.1 alpha/beta hydrolase [Peterkaempfera bronchialis]